MKKRLLSLNVYYAPRSFGGATIVAERINSILADKHDWDVTVVTTIQDPRVIPYQTQRYTLNNVDVIAINLPQNTEYRSSYSNPGVGRKLGEIVESFKPDIVHCHAIQTMGVELIDEVVSREVPIVMTLHDCWNICDRQFMINRHGKYCFQKEIDSMACLHCVDIYSLHVERKEMINKAVSKVDKFLFPSNFHMQMHLLNGYEDSRCLVSKNGIRFPSTDYKSKSNGSTTFGFLGGPGAIKGGYLIKEVFQQLDDEGVDYDLVLVDAGAKIQQSWKRNFELWDLKGNVTIIPPFDQETMSDFYGQIDVLLFPSQWKESFGLTVREALVRDVYIISTNGGGTIEDLVEDDNATIIPISSNSIHLYEAVVNALAKDFTQYSNPHKESIETYEMQTKKLNNTLLELLSIEV